MNLIAFLFVTLTGIEPISKEPESSILSIKLQGQNIEPLMGLEPTTYSLRMNCSTN
jgi:hypothetical protein